MKLYNFLDDKGLDNLRGEMNAPLKKWESESTWNSFDPLGFRKILNEKGEVDIPFSEINIGSDNTLELFGQKILVYIRDQRAKYNGQYKFHISNCTTLSNAIKNKRYDRYVASVNTDGIFKINIINNNKHIEKEVELKVCKNCLDKLNYKNYNESYLNRSLVYESFNLDEFFKIYSKQSIIKPKYTSKNAPIDKYSKDFKVIADELKEAVGYKCEKCNKYLSGDKKRYLHAHHINGNKADNERSNLRVLCIKCHAEEPNHGHMKGLPDYWKFISQFES